MPPVPRWKNFFLLSAVVVGVMIPVGLRYWFRREVADLQVIEEEPGLEDEHILGRDRILAVGPPGASKKVGTTSPMEPYYDDESSDDDEDVILEAGPAIPVFKVVDDDEQESATPRS